MAKARIDREYIQNLANEFGINNIDTIFVPDDIIKKFYKANPDLKPIKRAAMRSTPPTLRLHVHSQTTQPPQLPAAAPKPAPAHTHTHTPTPTPKSKQSTTIDNPIVLSDSSDDEDEESDGSDGYSTAPGSPTSGDTELDRVKNKLSFYKDLCAGLQQQLQAVSLGGAAKKHPSSHDKHHQHTSSRKDRKLEASARRAQHEAKRGSFSRPAGGSSKYISQEEQVRHANKYRIPVLKLHVAQREGHEDNQGPPRRDVLKYRKRSAAPPPPDVSGHNHGIVMSDTPEQPAYIPHVAKRIQPTLVQAYPPSFASGHNEKKVNHPLQYKSLHQTLGLNTTRQEAGPSQASSVPQAPICPTEIGGLNCVERNCKFSHFNDFKK